MEERIIKCGFLRSWNALRGYGFVEIPGSKFPVETYFLHARSILDGQNPPPQHALVRFEVGKTHGNGKFPSAEKATVVDPRNVGKGSL